MLKQLGSLLLVAVLYGVSTQGNYVQASDSLKTAIGATIDNMHLAASKGDKAAYLGAFTENAVFMGTDDWERWSRPEQFDQYVSEHFKDGQGWSYRSLERHINLAADGNTAWFDEIIFSDKWGKFRGTGVLLMVDGKWRIAHYSMAFLVPNEVWEQVSEISSKAFAERDKQ